MKPEKLYRCPICGGVLTEETWLEGMDAGGSGYCMCEYMMIDPGTREPWYPRILHEYDVYHLSAPSAKEGVSV